MDKMIYCTALHAGLGRRVFCEMTHKLAYGQYTSNPVFCYEDVGPGQIVLVEATIGQLYDIEPEAGQ